LGVRVVGKRVLAARGRLAGVEVGVGQTQPAGLERIERLVKPISRLLKALEKHLLDFGRRRFVAQDPKRSDFWHQLVDDRQETGEDTRSLVARAELLLVIPPRQVEDELILLHAGTKLVDLVMLIVPSDLGHLWDR